MKKKMIVSLLAVMSIFVFCGNALSVEQCKWDTECPCDPAAQNCGDVAEVAGGCEVCGKHTPGNIPYPTTISTPGSQGQPGTTTTTAATPFDFDGMRYEALDDAGEQHGSYGYCAGFNSGTYTDIAVIKDDTSAENGKFIFDLCRCPAACIVEEGSVMGIQMIVDTPGVYFSGGMPTITTGFDDAGNALATPLANPNVGQPTVFFQQIAVTDINSACTTTTAQNATMARARVFLDANNKRIPTEPATNIRNEVRNFGPVAYFRNVNDTILHQSLGDYFKTTVSDDRTPLAGSNIGAIPEANKARVLQSFQDTSYIFNTDDMGRNCFLWIDIPPLRIDPTEAVKGATIKVRVRLMFYQDPTICEDCAPPAICECELTVGIIGCGETASADGKCMFFPYVLQNLSPWWSGIAVTAREDELPADASLTLTAKDQNGNMGTYTVTNVAPLWTSIIDSIIPQFTMTKGTIFTGGAISLKVESNYSMVGYSFLTDGTFGAGTLATGCTEGSCGP